MDKLKIIARIEHFEKQIRHAEQKISAGRDVKMASILIETAKKEITQLNEILQEIESKES
jgi:hypothetical protein